MISGQGARPFLARYYLRAIAGGAEGARQKSLPEESHSLLEKEKD